MHSDFLVEAAGLSFSDLIRGIPSCGFNKQGQSVGGEQTNRMGLGY